MTASPSHPARPYRLAQTLAQTIALCLALLWPAAAAAQDLTVDNKTITLGGIHTYKTVRVINGGKIIVPKYDGTDKLNTGNLQIRAESILVDATSSIIADGAGYQPLLCDNGRGPNPTAGGRGGCAVLDSGGGGAHFGVGGRGTKDCFIVAPANSCQFPAEYEENCGTKNAGNSCSDTGGGCYNYNALPTVAGQPYQHSIYEVEFGAAGGDKGCRDGDGFGCGVGGAGGGRIVLAAINAAGNATLEIRGRVSALGWRGCGSGNDSAGGGAGGSLLLVGNQVNITATANVSVAGGLGGDTNAKGDPNGHCPSCAQNPGGTCDDCGGGGGGGIISVLAGVPPVIESKAVFDVSGAFGGTCPICKGEAGGGAGELQLAGLYVGEFCDGYDNDFDGQTDELQGNTTCGGGACQSTVAACDTSKGLPNDCVPKTTASCQPALKDTRSRFLVIVDTSASMLTDLSGVPTFGDGSAGHAGLDTNGDGKKNDSRLYKAKQALTQVINAYPEIDFGLARFAQDVDTKVNCQLAHWFECAGICCSYDNPTNNSGGTPPEGPCTVSAGAAGNIVVQPTSPGDECVNYAGSCGKPRRGADIVVGFEKPIGQSLMWLDHKETKFDKSTVEGNHCNFAGGGDCELRGTGPTPLAGSLLSAVAYLKKTRAEDRIASCRNYSVILLTDGAETCQGKPVSAAGELLTLGVESYVIGFSVLSSEQASLNAIAKAGSNSGTRQAFFVGDEQQLAAAVASIVADSVVFEVCNDKDDDCDLLIDEDFPLKGQPCDNGLLGACFATGVYVCKADGSGVECNAKGKPPGLIELCNGKDDNCNGQIDEGLTKCNPCIPQPEICNNKDDNCNGKTDEGLKIVDCGSNVGACRPGKTKCVAGVLQCDGGQGPAPERCNSEDDDCDGIIDGMARPCYPFAGGCDKTTGICAGTCTLGTEVCTAGAWGSCVGANGPQIEVCDGVDNNCDGQVDEQAACPGNSQCVEGQCTRPCTAGEFVCPAGQICQNGYCIIDPCDADTCSKTGPNHLCIGGQCRDACAKVTCKIDRGEQCIKGRCEDTTCYAKGCPSGQTCVQAACVADPCGGVSCPATQFCQAGTCVDLCAYLTCGAGETCQVVQENGKPLTRCIKDPCAAKLCGQGLVCVAGSCVSESCSGVTCPLGETCIKGACKADRCEVTRCPAGFRCVEGNCLSERTSGRLLATGAGGLACSLGDDGGDSTPPYFSALLLLGLLALRRRGGGVR